jgi:hypothetical protein
MARTSHSVFEREAYNLSEEFLLYRTGPMNLQQATALFLQEFPEFDRSQPGAKARPLCKPGFSAPSVDEYAMARCVAKLLAERKTPRVQAAFDLLETVLTNGDSRVRDWVCGFVRALQDVAGWREPGYEAFIAFLQPETRRAWSALAAIQTDLADCSILEEEITMWRVVHHPQACS